MASLEITLWLFFVSTVLVHSDQKCGLGDMKYYATWVTEIGGLIFPNYGRVDFLSPERSYQSIECRSQIEDSMLSCNNEPLQEGCQYCSKHDKLVCKGKIDENNSSMISNNRTLSALVLTGFDENSDSLENYLTGEVLSIWKIADSIFSKKPPKFYKFNGNMDVNMIKHSIAGHGTLSFPYLYHYSYNLNISGEIFSNENRDGYIVILNLELDGETTILSGDLSVVEDGLTMQASGDLYHVNGRMIAVNLTMNYVSLLSTDLTFQGSSKICDHCFFCFIPKCETMIINGNISSNEDFYQFNVTGNFNQEKLKEKKFKEGTFMGSFLSDNNQQSGIHIPDSAFSNMSVHNVIFNDCTISKDFDLEALTELNDVETVTFIRSKIEYMNRASLTWGKLKALYFENSLTSGTWSIGAPLFNQLEMISFKESGPFNHSTLTWLENAGVKYMNLQHTNFVWDVIDLWAPWTSSILQPIAETLEYLDLSYSTVELKHLKTLFKGIKLKRLSVAGLNLNTIPYEALEQLSSSLEYLTLRNNNFMKVKDNNLAEDATLTFPEMEKLIELDLSSCNINLIEAGAFDNLQRLQRIYLSGNKIANIQDGWFRIIPPITYMDLSYNKQSVNMIPIINYEGRDYEDMTRFSKLEILDLSYSQFTEVEWTLKGLSETLLGLSLCYSNIVYKYDDIFKYLKNLQVLDISGTLNSEVVELTKMLSNLQSLRFLYLNENDISDHFLSDVYNVQILYLNSLEYLSLKDNNIKVLDWNVSTFFPSLSILDVSYNSISQWNTSLVPLFPKLDVLFINDNKIDHMTDLMVSDIMQLNRVSLKNNPFICDCYTNNITYLASVSSEFDTNISTSMLKTMIGEKPLTQRYFLNASNIHIFGLLYSNMMWKLNSNSDILSLVQYKIVYGIEENDCFSSENIRNDEYKSSVLNDFNDQNYQCYSKEERKSYAFSEIGVYNSCMSSQVVSSVIHPETPLTTIYIITISLLCLVTIVGIVYWKWWYIRYFSILIKNATVLSFMDKEEKRLLTYKYDVFVSYSDNDRPWVLDHLIPNLESRNELRVCLHERDFQVGLSILENIIASLDKSRCIILVVSKSFIKSRWCQFEMHLAQHRLIETRRSQLILIFLDHIPRYKRPKTLQYLMVTKTYIKWPSDETSRSEIQIFWNRLKRSLSECYV